MVSILTAYGLYLFFVVLAMMLLLWYPIQIAFNNTEWSETLPAIDTFFIWLPSFGITMIGAMISSIIYAEHGAIGFGVTALFLLCWILPFLFIAAVAPPKRGP